MVGAAVVDAGEESVDTGAFGSAVRHQAGRCHVDDSVDDQRGGPGGEPAEPWHGDGMMSRAAPWKPVRWGLPPSTAAEAG